MIDLLYDAAFRVMHADVRLVTSFFVVMSRFEYAVKVTGYVRGDSEYMPAWRKLGESINPEHECYQVHDIAEAVRYLLMHPPKKLNAKGAWVPRGLCGPTEPAMALDAVVGVRNNLFHGRKGDARDRNDRLFECCLLIIQAVMQEKPRIFEVYTESYR